MTLLEGRWVCQALPTELSGNHHWQTTAQASLMVFRASIKTQPTDRLPKRSESTAQQTAYL